MTVMSAAFSVYTKYNEACVKPTTMETGSKMALSANQTLQLQGDQRWRMVICHQGVLWVTQENDLEDYVLKPGDMLLISLRGKIVTQALEDVILEITPSLKSHPYRGDHVFFN